MSAFKNPLTESVEHGLHSCDGFAQHLNLEPRRHLGLDMGECLRCLQDDFFKEFVNGLFEAAGLGGGVLPFIDGQGVDAFAKRCTDLAAQRLARALC